MAMHRHPGVKQQGLVGPAQIVQAKLISGRLLVCDVAMDRVTADAELFGDCIERCTADAQHFDAMTLGMLADRARGRTTAFHSKPFKKVGAGGPQR